ncbi:MAG: transglutaminase family protein [Bacteroidota bacterium]
MSLVYSIRYFSTNHYVEQAKGASWQFLILPENNHSQQLVDWSIHNSLNAPASTSINGLGFKTVRIQTNRHFNALKITANLRVQKERINPFDFIPNTKVSDDYALLETHDFKVDNEPYLRNTYFTWLPEKHTALYTFDRKRNVFENLRALNAWVYSFLKFKVGVTGIHTSLKEVVKKRQGVCQDFTHLFLAIARDNHVPARYVSGYLHQGSGFFGDSQMHAWVEVYVPNGGWIGFDPTNNILADQNHIKVCHGIDYQDCSPIKGVVYSVGGNNTSHTVEVIAAQQ